MGKRTAGLVALSWAATSLAAQAQSVPPAASAADTAKRADALQVIVITAERRPERLDQVPVAASVVLGKSLEDEGVRTLNDLGSVAPSLTIANQNALSYVNIRGVGLQVTNPTTSSGVAVYSDGFFIPHETAIADEYLDVAQIEVLRGPQGTLVGQSSTGGAIFVGSTRPTFEGATGYVQQTAGNYGFTKTEGAYNMTVSDDLAIRVAGNFYNRNSYFTDIHVGNSPATAGLQPGEEDSQSGRIGVLWRPSSTFNVYIKYETTTRKGDGYAAKNYGELGGVDNNIDARLSNPWVISYDQPGWDKYRVSRVSSEIKWNIADRLLLRSLTGYQHDTLANQFDNDNTLLPLSWVAQTFDETALEQELDLISQNPGPLNWLVGAFYLRDSTPTYLYLYTAPPGPPPPLTIRTQPIDRSYAAFAQATYNFSPRWQLLLGARENRDETVQTGTQTLDVATGLPPPAPSVVSLVVPLDASPRTTTPTGKLALSFFPNEDSTLYVSGSRGFKAGGANAGNLLNLTFKPETIDAYEGGYKATFLNRQLRIAAAEYYYDYRNMQVNVLDKSGQQAIINVPKSRIYGSELELSGQFGPVAFTSGVGYNESRVNQPLALVDAGNPLSGPQQLDGRQLPYAPKWTAHTSATYQQRTSVGRLAFTLQYSYASTAYASVFQLFPRDLLAAHRLLNANLSLMLRDGIRLEIYGTNLSNALYAAGTQGTDSVIWGPPREYGARVGYYF